jgi:putative ABC transport system substrate-binding protein
MSLQRAVKGITRRGFFVAATVLVFLSLLSAQAYSAPYKATIITNLQKGIYQRTIDSIQDTINALDIGDIDLKVITEEDFGSKKQLTTLLEGQELVISVGLGAATTVVALERRPPLLATLIPREALMAIVRDLPDKNDKEDIAAIVLDQPLERLLALTRVLFDGAKTVGLLIGPSTEVTQQEFEALGKKWNLATYSEIVEPDDNLFSKLNYVLENSDILIATPDALIFNRRTVGSLLQSTYRRRVPVIAFSKSYVRAGALAATYTSPEQIGRQTAETIARIMKNGFHSIPISQPPKYFSVAINKQVARSFGLVDLSESKIKQLVETRAEIKP